MNSWWYRRRKAAKKLKIIIPRDTYELDVGIPPHISASHVKEEFSADNFSVNVALENANEQTQDDDLTVASLDMHISSSDDSYLSLDCTLSPSALILSDNQMNVIRVDENDAYIQQTQFPEGNLSSFIRATGPELLENDCFLPANMSSPPTSRSTSPCALYLHSELPEDSIDSRAFSSNQIIVSNDTRGARGIRNETVYSRHADT